MWKKSRESKSDVTRGKRIKLFGLFVLTVLSLALAQNLVGRASVVDGDTLEVQGVRIRLWGIDAVESSQTCLDAAGPLGDGRYAIVAGERRYRAAKMAGLAEVPVWVLDLPEKEARLLALVENL